MNVTALNVYIYLYGESFHMQLCPQLALEIFSLKYKYMCIYDVNENIHYVDLLTLILS